MSTVRIQVRRGTASEWTSVNPTLAAGELGVETDTRKIKIGTGSTAWTSLSYIAADSPAITEIAQDAIDQALSMGSGLTKSYNDNTNTISLGIDDSVVALKSYVDSQVGGLENTVTSDYVLIADVGNAGGPAKLDVDGNLLIPKSSIILEGSSADDYETTLTITNPTADRTITFPNASGTVALTSDIDALIDGAPGALNTLNELSAALGDDADYAGTITTALGALTQAGLNHAQSTTNVHGHDLTAFALTSEVNSKITTDISDAISDHNVTTNIHGIADTSILFTTDGGTLTGSLTLAGAPSADLEASTKKYVDDQISTHSSDSTSVHGIADTSALATKTYVDNAGSALQTNIDAKAPIANPTFTGTVAGITKSMVGLGNVDNTSDADKPVSTATQTALDGKASLSGATFTGSVEIDQNLVVDGDFTVNGTNFAASATSITIEDNMIQLAHQNSANTVDLGLVVAYNDGAAKHSGIVRDVSDSKWKLFKGVTDEPATTVNFAQGSLDDLEVNNLTAAGIVFSDGTQTKVGVPSITTFATEITSSATLAAGEEDKFVPLNGAVEITLPSSGYETGESIDFYQSSGTGASFASTNSVVGTPGLKFRTTNSVVTAMKTPSGWLVFGDLKA